MREQRLLFLLAAILLLLLAVDTVSVLQITNNHDFAVYLQGAHRLRNGQDIYAELSSFRAFIESGQSTKDIDTPWPFSTPPFHALLLLPLTLLPDSVASLLWTALGIAAIAIACWLVLRSQGWLTLSGCVVMLLLIYQYYPAVVALRLGQIDLEIFLLLALAFVWLKSGADAKAGLALGVAIGIKVFAGFVVLYLLWKRRWVAAFWAAASGAVFFLGGFALVGWDAFKRYLSFTSLYTWGAFAGYPYHQSINAFLTRSFKPNIFLAPVADAPWLATLLTIGLSLLLVAGLLWLTRTPSAASDARFDLEYALVVTTMLLVLPPAPLYAFTWLLLGFIIVARRVVSSSVPLWLTGLVALAYLLAGRVVYFPLPLLRRLVMDGQFMLAALLLWAALAWLLWRSGQATDGLAVEKGVS